MNKILSIKIKYKNSFLNLYFNEYNHKYTALVEGSQCFKVFENKYFEQDCCALDCAEVEVFKKLGLNIKK